MRSPIGGSTGAFWEEQNVKTRNKSTSHKENEKKKQGVAGRGGWKKEDYLSTGTREQKIMW